MAELIILARALDVAPLALLYDVITWGTVEVTPGVEVPMLQAAEWFTGEKFLEDEVLSSIGEEVRAQFGVLQERLTEDVDAAEERVVDTITEAWMYHSVSASSPPVTQTIGPEADA